MDGLGHDWLLGRGKSERTALSLFCGENALNPHPQRSSNSSPPAQVSKDHFSPLEG